MVSRDYFQENVQWDGSAAYEPQWRHMPDLAGFEAADGLTLRPFWGAGLMASHANFAPNAIAPLHKHDQEQLTVVLSGSLHFTVGEEVQWMNAGDIVSIPAGVPHAATAGSDGAVAIDMFSPPRDGFRELVEKNSGTS